MKDPPDLSPEQTPLKRLWSETTERARFSQEQVTPRERSVLYGPRGLYKPRMALKAIPRLGPVRHALAQRAVCGLLEVHAPFAPELSVEAKDLLAETKKSQRFELGQGRPAPVPGNKKRR